MKNKNIKILYLAPKYPYPRECGEDYGYDKDIKSLSESKYADNTLILIADRTLKNGNFPYKNIEYQIFKPNYKKSNLVFKNLIYILNLIFSKYPQNMNKFITEEYKYKIEGIDANVIILDSIYAMSMLPKRDNYKLIYIAHNYEYQLARSVVKLQKNILKKIYFYFLSMKMKKLETELTKRADRLVCVSTSDYKYFSKQYPEKTLLFPHSASCGNYTWDGSSEKVMLFCGPIGHHPNKEAIEWIVNELSPILSPDIKIKIVGQGTDTLGEAFKRDNVEFLGFISSEELKNLYKTCSAFICPIVYGSGVKIKVTEAVSYGMPIIATKESLEGLDYIDIKPLIDRNNMEWTKENIESLLNDKTKLKLYSTQLIEQSKVYEKECSKNSLEKIIDDIMPKNSNYDIISLGYDCAVRRYLTMGGLKKTKAQGELSMVFDLLYCPTESLIKILKNNFKDYFNNLTYRNNVWVNKKYKILYNHDKDCGINDKSKITERFQKRIDNFRNIVKTSQYCYFVLKSISSARKINHLYKILKKIRNGKNFKLIVLDVEQKLTKYNKFNIDIAVCSAKSPFPKTDDWWKAEYIDSVDSINFREEICNFITSIIEQDFIVSKYSKEDVNLENGEY